MMLPTTFLAIVLAVWSSFHLVHNFISGNPTLGPWLDKLLHNNNIFITPFQVRWFTQRWNRCFVRLGRCWNLKLWFDGGVLFALISMIISVGLLCHTLINSMQDLPIFAKQPKLQSPQVLTVIVPGVNLPIRDIGYLAIAVLISGVLHELGHAVAAASEGVHVNGFGVFLFTIYPGAYVDLNSEDLSRSNPRKQLRIYCAGVWHNFIICVVVCILILSLPLILTPFYARHGLIVTHQYDYSPLHGDNGLQVGDTIKNIGHCSIADINDWYQCINKSISIPQMGSCVSMTKIHQMDILNQSRDLNKNIISPSTWFDCCGENSPQTHLCYTYNQAGRSDAFACLPGRMMMSHKDCFNNQDCDVTNKPVQPEQEQVCTTPHIAESKRRFMRIVVSRDAMKHHVLYLGEPTDLTRFITVSEYMPRMPLFPLRLPAILLRFLQYMFSMSGALALLNIVPCYALDGQWAFKAFVDYFYSGRIDVNVKEKFCTVVLTLGTLLIVTNILFGFLHIMMR